MKRKIVLCVFVLLLGQMLFAEDSTVFDIPLGDRRIMCTAKEVTANGYSPEKTFVLVTDGYEYLDSTGYVKFYDGAYKGGTLITDNAFACRITLNDPYQNCFLYASSTSDHIARYDCPKWVADGIITDDYIIYSTEMVDNTVRRISLADNTVYEYDGYFPNVDLFPLENDEGILGIFRYNGAWYELYEDRVVKTGKQYSPEKKKALGDFWGK